MDHGDDCAIYNKFEQVFSGHYHTRSSHGNIHYLGNPYEIYWNDVDDPRGFNLYDTDTLELTQVNNPHQMFHHVYYNDTPHQLVDTSKYKDKIIKIIVKQKSNLSDFEKFIEKFVNSNVHDIKVVENFDFNGYYNPEEIESDESEDTISILNRYIDESDVSLNKSQIKNLLKEVYIEACEVE